MTEELESALRRTLTDAADRAPKAPPGLVDGLAGQRPRTGRRSGPVRMVLVAAAVIVVLGGSTLAVRPLLRGNNTPAGALERPGPVSAPPIAKVWPKAVRTVPGTLPNGKVYAPQVFLDDHTMLVSTESGFEKADALYAYDLRRHTARRITEIVHPPHVKTFASGFTAGSGHVAWWLETRQGVEIWGAPSTGGTAHRITRQPDAGGLTRLVLTGGEVLWSVNRGGVYRTPLTGGQPKAVPGTTGTHILAWPWVGGPYGPEGVGERQTAFEHLRDTRTGETRSADLTNGDMWTCGLSWCVGMGHGGAYEARRRDGTGHHALPNQGMGSDAPPTLDRFVTVVPSGKSHALYDLGTGRMGDLGDVVNKASRGSIGSFRDPANRLLYVEVADGYLIVDLAAIH